MKNYVIFFFIFYKNLIFLKFTFEHLRSKSKKKYKVLLKIKTNNFGDLRYDYSDWENSRKTRLV